MGSNIIIRILTGNVSTRDEYRARYRRSYSYRSMCLPDREWQAAKLESLRYRFGGYRHGFRIVQHLHNSWWLLPLIFWLYWITFVVRRWM